MMTRSSLLTRTFGVQRQVCCDVVPHIGQDHHLYKQGSISEETELYGNAVITFASFFVCAAFLFESDPL